jgi:type VI secretion system protein VasG
MIDAILTNSLLPALSKEFLIRMASGTPINRVDVSVADGDFRYALD